MRCDLEQYFQIEGQSASFISYGVSISIETNDQDEFLRILDSLVSDLSGKIVPYEKTRANHCLRLIFESHRKASVIYNDKFLRNGVDREFGVRLFESQIKLTVAEFAEKHVFIHSATVVWHEQAILLPASSHAGKSTMAKALCELGATYYSDEYAVFDRRGMVYPFPKPLSMRLSHGENVQTDIPVEQFGFEIGTSAARVGLIVFTDYEPNSNWRPQLITSASSAIRLMAHSIPIRRNPDMTLEVIKKVVLSAKSIASKRPDSQIVAKSILELADS